MEKVHGKRTFLFFSKVPGPILFLCGLVLLLLLLVWSCVHVRRPTILSNTEMKNPHSLRATIVLLVTDDILAN